MNEWHEYRDLSLPCQARLLGNFFAKCGASEHSSVHHHYSLCSIGHKPNWLCHPYTPPKEGPK